MCDVLHTLALLVGKVRVAFRVGLVALSVVLVVFVGQSVVFVGQSVVFRGIGCCFEGGWGQISIVSSGAGGTRRKCS